MKKILLFSICAAILFTLIPYSYAELYYNQIYSFSVEYPDGWNVEAETQDVDIGIAHFFDGKEFSYFGGIWNSHVAIQYSPDLGQKLSDTEERKYQIDYERDRCRNAAVNSGGQINCSNFNVIRKLPPTFTIDGYPKITTIISTTNDYPEYPTSRMVITITSIYVGTAIWDIYSESDYDVYDEHESKIFRLVNSFKHPALPPVSAANSNEEGGGGCLIATAAFGSEMAPQVQFLRELRDNTVLQTESGTSFMTGFNQFYYSFSPTVADYERENPAFKEAVKLTLTPLLTSLTLLQYADIDSESEMLGYGIGVILLNIGMYFVAPAVLIMKIRKRI